MKNHWQNYKELELIPDSVPEPDKNRITFLNWLGNRQKARLEALLDSASFEEKVGYLERSLTLDCAVIAGHSGFWGRLWYMLNQPIRLGWRKQSPPSEPQICQIADREGHIWWQAYDPLTGQTTYLDSEEEVQIWLEERLYH